MSRVDATLVWMLPMEVIFMLLMESMSRVDATLVWLLLMEVIFMLLME
jgi:hypothetical protein